MIAAEDGSSVAQFLRAYRYGIDRPVIDEAVRKGDWVSCGLGDCWYKGTPESVRIHQRKYH